MRYLVLLGCLLGAGCVYDASYGGYGTPYAAYPAYTAPPLFGGVVIGGGGGWWHRRHWGGWHGHGPWHGGHAWQGNHGWHGGHGNWQHR